MTSSRKTILTTSRSITRCRLHPHRLASLLWRMPPCLCHRQPLNHKSAPAPVVSRGPWSTPPQQLTKPPASAGIASAKNNANMSESTAGFNITHASRDTALFVFTAADVFPRPADNTNASSSTMPDNNGNVDFRFDDAPIKLSTPTYSSEEASGLMSTAEDELLQGATLPCSPWREASLLNMVTPVELTEGHRKMMDALRCLDN